MNGPVHTEAPSAMASEGRLLEYPGSVSVNQRGWFTFYPNARSKNTHWSHEVGFRIGVVIVALGSITQVVAWLWMLGAST